MVPGSFPGVGALHHGSLDKSITMFKYILENAGNINWMAIFALITFFALFVISAVVIITKRKSWIDKMAHLPLEDNTSFNSENIHRQ